jgi:hypothetical protein
VALLAGCGAHTTAHGPAPAWRANAVGVVQQLREDADVATTGAMTPRSAARRLAAISDLYALLVVYDDLGACSAMAARAGAPLAIEHALALPCPHLERAAALFTRAIANADARALVQATREVLRAEPLLVRALAEVGGRQTVRGEK